MIILVISQAVIHHFQHLQCESLLFFFVIYRCKLTLFMFWTGLSEYVTQGHVFRCFTD